MAMDKEPYRPGLSKDSLLVQQLQEFERNPKSLIFASLADRYRSQGLIKQALEILREGFETHPDFGPAKVVEARCFFDLKRYADCLELLANVLAKNPENVKAERLRSDVFLRLGQKQAAIGSLTRVLALIPNHEPTRRALAELRDLTERSAVTPQEHVEIPPFSGFSEPGRILDFQVHSRGDISFTAEAAPPISAPSAISPPQVAVGGTEPIESVTDEQKLGQDSVEALAPADSRADQEEDEELNPLGGVTFATKTVAELYLRQGLAAKAEKILEMMLERNPADRWAAETLQKISQKSVKQDSSQLERTRLMLKARYLERLLMRVQSIRRANVS